MSPGIYFQILTGNTTGFQAVDLLQQHLWVDDGTCADEALSTRIENARGNQVQFVDLSLIFHGVARIVATLGTHHYIGTEARMSMIFPLPSSPHWTPTTTLAGNGITSFHHLKLAVQPKLNTQLLL